MRRNDFLVAAFWAITLGTAVVRIVGQLGGYGPVVSSELEGTSFGK